MNNNHPHRRQSATAFLRQLTFRSAPGTCLLCRQPSHQLSDLCLDCEADMPRNTSCCQICAVPLHQPSICGRCLKNRPVFSSVIAPWIYTEPTSLLINGFKRHGQFTRGYLLYQKLISEVIDQLSISNPPDALIATPLHWKKRWQRGFNQAHWIAKQLSQDTGIPILSNKVRRNCHTPSQQGLPRQQRLKNLRGCFTVSRPFNGEKLAIVDDVMTTGSTAQELGKSLLKSGAAEVVVWCLARTPLEK